ncbi:MAG: DUF2791 family P-loop domain-containing protein [Deltaproteobacteria bacterium]|nr:DUF2791 family P-loop domain-containing protein [Deltaproteobacteria bacterium]
MSAPSLDTAWRRQVIAARAQSLEDAATTETASVAVLLGAPDDDFVNDLESDALDRGFATATVSLAEHSLHQLDDLLGAAAAGLRLYDVKGSRKHGLLAALEAFAAEHGREAEARFEEFADVEVLHGDLRDLALEVLGVLGGRTASRRVTAFFDGKPITLSDDTELRQLSSRTAKNGMNQLTRLLRALGYRGLRLMLTDAEALAGLTRVQREVAYTVLRELIDNADGHRGMMRTEILLIGTPALVDRVGGLRAHPALASRLLGDATVEAAADVGLPQPHRTVQWIEPPEGTTAEELAGAPPKVEAVPDSRAKALHTHLRLVRGLPPTEGLEGISVGMEALDAELSALFAHASHDSSVFAILSGDYGSGKTHRLLHLESLALAENRPVFRLSVERLDEDLGNPQRHLRRLLESSTLPGRQGHGPLEQLELWLASAAATKHLHEALEEVSMLEVPGAKAAARALRGSEEGLDVDHVRSVLGALDLEQKPGAPTYRRDAYARLHLWVELLARLADTDGPLIVLDEAENLFRAGVSRAERRTALRSLSFYCGGWIERGVVVLAVTPDTLSILRSESAELLEEIDGQATHLPEEDVTMLRRRLRSRPLSVARMGREELEELADRAYQVGCKARGLRRERSREELLETFAKGAKKPREVVQRVAQHVEGRAWSPAD